MVIFSQGKGISLFFPSFVVVVSAQESYFCSRNKRRISQGVCKSDASKGLTMKCSDRVSKRGLFLSVDHDHAKNRRLNYVFFFPRSF